MTEPISFDVFTRRVLTLYSTGKHAPSTLGHVRQVLAELAALGATRTADLTTDLMVRWVASKGSRANANTINSLLSAASAACAYAVEERWLDRPPSWRRVRMRPGPTVRNAPPPFAEVARLLDELAARRGESWEAHRLMAAVWTVALTGLRRNEALCLRLEDFGAGPSPSLRVDPAAQPRARLKTPGSERRVPIPDALAAVLAGWAPLAGPVWLFPGVRRVGPWLGGSGTRRPLGALQEAARRVGIPRVTWHSLRHSYGTAAVERWGVPLWALQRLMGHTDSRTTQRYLHLDGSPRIVEATRGIGYVLPGPPAFTPDFAPPRPPDPN